MAVPTFDFMPFGDAVTRDPYPIYDRMWEEGPLLTTPFGALIVHRYDSPVQLLFRGVTQPTEVAGIELAPDQMVFTILAAANRDPEAFPGAATFDVERKAKPHVSFGHGIHFCLGAPLARLEAMIALEELLEMVPRFEVVTPDEELEYPPGLFFRSPRQLDVLVRSELDNLAKVYHRWTVALRTASSVPKSLSAVTTMCSPRSAASKISSSDACSSPTSATWMAS